MQQVSPPFRIALIAIALLGAVWFVALRPKPQTAADAPLPAAPGVTGLTKSIGKATAATNAANASVQRTESAASVAAGDSTAAKATVTRTAKAGSTKVTKSVSATKTPAGATKVTKTVTAATPKGAVTVKKSVTKPADPAAPLVAALDRGQVVVLLFRNASSDSADVAVMVRSVGRRRKVVSKVVSIKDVGRYQTFTSGTPVAQAPTTMIIGPRRNAKVIVGFTSVGEIAQAVADVRRAGRATS